MCRNDERIYVREMCVCVFRDSELWRCRFMELYVKVRDNLYKYLAISGYLEDARST